MDKKEFIRYCDKETNHLLNEKNLWGIIYDYLELCFKCKKIIDNKKRYYINDKRVCHSCLTSGLLNG